MRQVPIERTGARGPATTGAGLTGAGGGKPTQPTLDVVLGGPAGAPSGSPAPEQATTLRATPDVTVRPAPRATSGPASEAAAAVAPLTAAPMQRDPATAVEAGTATSVDIAGTRAAEAAGAPTSGRAATRAGERVAKPTTEPVLINRELSWLDFNGRVLAQVEDESLPLLERARFLAIASRALDEFFQVRVGGLKQLAAGLEGAASDPHGPQAQVRAIRTKVVDIYARQARAFLGGLVPQLDQRGIRFSDWSSLDEEDRAHLDKVFEERIFPVLTPLAVDPAHPFPYISSLSLNLMVVVMDPASHEQRIARIKVPPLLSRFVVLPDGERFVPIEQVIAAHLHPLFEGMKVVAHHVFRLTRNADYQLDGDEAEDLVEAVRAVLKERRRSPLVVRLEVGCRHARGDGRPARPRAGDRRRGRLHGRRAARPGRPLRRLQAGPSRPQVPPLDADHPTPDRPRPGELGGRPLPRPPRGPGARPPPLRQLRAHRRGVHRAWPPRTPRCWPSSRPSTGPRDR